MRVFIINTNIKGSDTKWVYAVHSTLEGAKSHLEDLRDEEWCKAEDPLFIESEDVEREYQLNGIGHILKE